MQLRRSRNKNQQIWPHSFSSWACKVQLGGIVYLMTIDGLACEFGRALFSWSSASPNQICCTPRAASCSTLAASIIVETPKRRKFTWPEEEAGTVSPSDSLQRKQGWMPARQSGHRHRSSSPSFSPPPLVAAGFSSGARQSGWKPLRQPRHRTTLPSSGLLACSS